MLTNFERIISEVSLGIENTLTETGSDIPSSTYTSVLTDNRIKNMIKQTDEQIRKIILLEYQNRLNKTSKNPEIHIYNFPELKEIDNKIILKNVKYLINENLVRGGIDEEGENMFPWITKLTPLGIKLVEKESIRDN